MENKILNEKEEQLSQEELDIISLLSEAFILIFS